MLASVLFVGVLLSVELAHGYNHALEPVVPFQPNMAKLLMSSRLTSEDPAKAMTCFADYIRQSNEVSQRYSNDYKACLMQSKQERDEVDSNMLLRQQNLVATTMDVCQRLSKCNDMNSTMDSFKCHSQVGAENSRDVYVAAGNASDNVNVMQEHYRIVDLRHEQCCKTSERNYVKLTADNYRQLHDCLECKSNSILPSQNDNADASSSTTTTTTTTTVVVHQTSDDDVPPEVAADAAETAVVAAADAAAAAAAAAVSNDDNGKDTGAVETELNMNVKPTEGLNLLDLLN